MELKIEINMDNAAFEGTPEMELTYLLHKVGCRITAGEIQGKILDSNGNFCGAFEIIGSILFSD